MDTMTFERGILQKGGIINASIEGDNIFQVSGWSNQKTQIGVSLNQYNELKKIAEGYYNILVEKGIIEKEKTQEELLAEQIEMNKKTQETMNILLSYVKSLETEVSNIKTSTFNKDIDIKNVETNVKKEEIKQDIKDVEITSIINMPNENKNTNKLLSFK